LMGTVARSAVLQGPWALLASLGLIGVGVFLARGGRYQKFVERHIARRPSESPHQYFAIPLTMVFFGILAFVASVADLFKGR
jgi:hypothetical protein